MTIFDDIYRENRWNGVESRSGPGSGTAATRSIRQALLDVVREHDVRSVLDVGCGDGFWMPDVPGYVGIDVSSEAIALASARHPDRWYIQGNLGDIVRSIVPGSVDLVFCRDVIQHLPLDEGVALLGAMCLAGVRLMASTYVRGENVDVPRGGAYSPDLTARPFDLPSPDRWYFDGHYYHEHDTDQTRDPSKYMGLWSSGSFAR